MNDAKNAAQERLTVTLAQKASAGLAALQERTGLSKTDLVNRAIGLYEFVDRHVTAGAEVTVQYPDGTERQVIFL